MLGVESLELGHPRSGQGGLRSELERARLALSDLTLARSGGRTPPAPSPVLLERVVRGAAAGVDERADRAGRPLTLDWRAGPVTVRADRARLSQAFLNLLSNAVEHGGGGVELRGLRRPGRVRIEVRDFGPGFRGPWRADGRGARGRGLGIAARAVEEAGGSLHVDAAEPGAWVAVELPVVEA